jgi:hypothetical protein
MANNLWQRAKQVGGLDPRLEGRTCWVRGRPENHRGDISSDPDGSGEAVYYGLHRWLESNIIGHGGGRVSIKLEHFELLSGPDDFAETVDDITWEEFSR